MPGPCPLGSTRAARAGRERASGTQGIQGTSGIWSYQKPVAVPKLCTWKAARRKVAGLLWTLVPAPQQVLGATWAAPPSICIQVLHSDRGAGRAGKRTEPCSLGGCLLGSAGGHLRDRQGRPGSPPVKGLPVVPPDQLYQKPAVVRHTRTGERWALRHMEEGTETPAWGYGGFLGSSPVSPAQPTAGPFQDLHWLPLLILLPSIAGTSGLHPQTLPATPHSLS